MARGLGWGKGGGHRGQGSGPRPNADTLGSVFKQDLSEALWNVTPVGDLSEVPAAADRTIAAAVPGCVHLDLIRAGIIKHPKEGFAELEQFWVGKTDWRYECEFEASDLLFDYERLDLVCDGLDTIATVELNGIYVGAAANMFHPHRFDARPALRRGTNRLTITFKSPLKHIREEEARLGARPVNGDWDPYIFIRKAACNFGWDWAPKVPTCGVWKPIRLEAWSGVRIAGVRPRMSRTRGDVWRVSIQTDLEWAERVPAGLLLGASLEEHGLDAWASTVPEAGKPTTTISFDVENPRVWWPRGHGEQPLYYLKLSLHADGEVDGIADGWVGDVGFREVRLHTEPDEHGSRFEIHVNGKPIFCKGANWVPDTLFPTECTRERYRERVKQAADANMNMLRVWGGGFYEDEEFYRACDELGILVWQDFMFACAMYPEEAPFPELIEDEARHQITRLSSHASVALWCGGNECVWGYEAWGNAPGERPWKERLEGKTWGKPALKTWGSGYYFDLLPRLVSELDPSKPYWANSPWSGSRDIPTNSVQHGDRHTWDVQAQDYRKVVPRFCSEFGQQSTSQLVTLREVLEEKELQTGSRGLEHRQRATGGTARHIDEVMSDLGLPRDTFEKWVYSAWVLQRRALRYGIHALRLQRPRCMGALIWQLNEVWPGMSWSIIDSAGRPKPAWDVVREAFDPRLLLIQYVEGRHTIFGLNDLDQPWAGTLELQLMELRSTVTLSSSRLGVVIPPGSVAPLTDILGPFEKSFHPDRHKITATLDNATATWAQRV